MFPITNSQDDNFPGSGGFMHTDIALYPSGVLNAVTHTWEVTALRGFKGAVAVILLGGNRFTLWVSPTQHYGVDGRWLGTSDRRDNWSASVPPDILDSARYIGIIQQWDPDVAADIQTWAAGISDLATKLGPVIKLLATAAA